MGLYTSNDQHNTRIQIASRDRNADAGHRVCTNIGFTESIEFIICIISGEILTDEILYPFCSSNYLNSK